MHVRLGGARGRCAWAVRVRGCARWAGRRAAGLRAGGQAGRRVACGRACTNQGLVPKQQPAEICFTLSRNVDITHAEESQAQLIPAGLVAARVAELLRSISAGSILSLVLLACVPSF